MNRVFFWTVILGCVFATGYILGAAPRPPVKVSCKAYQWAEVYHLPVLRGAKD